MSARKPLDERCDGSVFCPVDGHVKSFVSSTGTKFSHIRLTPGQNRTVYERWQAKRTGGVR